MKKLLIILFTLLAGCAQSPPMYYATAFSVQLGDPYIHIAYAPDPLAYYPSFSKRSGESGDVEATFDINKSGDVENIKITKSSNFTRLDRAATEIISRYRFKPGRPGEKVAQNRVKYLLIFNSSQSENTVPDKLKVIELKNNEDWPPNSVVERLIVDEGGTVRAVDVVQSSKNESLDYQALKIGAAYKFKPILVDGKPVLVSTKIVVTFK